MNLIALILLVLAAFAHAGWNLAAKRAGDGGAVFVWLYQMVSAVCALPVMIAALVLTGSSPAWSWVSAAAVSAVLHNAYALVLQRGYAVGDMSVVYPVARGTGPVLSVSAAVVLSGERPGPFGLLGVTAVALGVFVIGFRSGERHRSPWVSVLYGGLTGVAIALFTLWDAHAMTVMALPPVVYSWVGSAMQGLMLAPYALHRRRRIAHLWRGHRGQVLTVGVLAPLAFVLVLYAMQMAPVSMVAPVRELSILVGSVLAWRRLGEPDPVPRLTGAAIVLAGIAAIVMAG